jgi:hypothetical protein
VLLSECTVCTAALQRREAVLAVGAYDPSMPMPGYEDWDLAIGMVERDHPGVLLRESLFRYRIRRGSMSARCMEPSNHDRLLRYMVAKHHETYRRHFPDLLEITEERTERLVRSSGGAREFHDAATVGPPRRPVGNASQGLVGTHAVTTVVTTEASWTGFHETLQALRAQTVDVGPIVVVETADAPLDEPARRDVASGGGRVLRTTLRGAAARAEGLAAAATPYVVALAAGDLPHARLLADAIQALEADPATAFVSYPVVERGGRFPWTNGGDVLVRALAAHVVAFPVTRVEAIHAVGGYDGGLSSCRTADRDLVIRLASSCVRSASLGDLPLERPPAGATAPDAESPHAEMRALFQRHRRLFETHWEEVFLAKEGLRRRLEVHRSPLMEAGAEPAAPSPVEWGSLRRVEPVSRVWGVDRGQPIDRYYIERFLDVHRSHIRGRVLEVKDPNYTRTFGSGIERCDVLDLVQHNPDATLIADLEEEQSLPPAAYDCFILTQTVHVIYDVRVVLRNAARALDSGGVLLATLPCVSRVDYESGLDSDFWRFTPASARRLFTEAFQGGAVEVTTAGNVLACCSFLMGLSAGELTPEELNHHDPYFPLIVCVRAVKSGTAP